MNWILSLLQAPASIVAFFTQIISEETKLENGKMLFVGSVGSAGYVLTTDHIIFFLTVLYLVGQLLLLVPKYIREWRQWKRENGGGS